MKILKFSCLLLFVAALFSCTQEKKPKKIHLKPADFKEPLIKANQFYSKEESDEIDQYIKFHKWEMISSGTGLRYMIYKKANGQKAENGMIAKVNFKVSLLDGTLCYSSDKTGAFEFLIGRDNVESGVHEGITYMHIGEKVILIAPSHLAHGLLGDDDKIPAKSSVVYDIELLALRKQ